MTALAFASAQRALRPVLSFVLSLVVLLGVLSAFAVVAAPPAAWAGGDSCGTCDGEIEVITAPTLDGFEDITTDGSGGNAGPGDDGSDGGGGSGGQPPSNDGFSFSGFGWRPARPPSPIGGGSHDLDVLWADNSLTATYDNQCEGNFPWTDARGVDRKAPYAGWTWAIYGVRLQPFTDPEGLAVPERYQTFSAAYKCVPPATYTVYPVWCPVATRAFFEGPYKNPVVPEVPGGVTFGPDPTAFANQGKDDRGLCQVSFNKTYKKDGLKAWGQYKLTASTQLQKCDYTLYMTKDPRTGVRPDPILSCTSGSPRRWVGPGTAYLELMCARDTEYAMHTEWHSGHSFTTEDCQTLPPGPDPDSDSSGSSVTWDCGPWPVSRFNGRDGSAFEVLDDGKARSLAWRTPTPGPAEYVKIVDGTRTVRLTLGDEDRISPYRGGSNANADNQPFTVSPQVDKWNAGWDGASDKANFTGWDLAFFAPGVPLKPWTVTPLWAFTGEFKTWMPDEWTFNFKTGTITVTKWKAVWVTAPASCAGPEVALDVYRARNSQGR